MANINIESFYHQDSQTFCHLIIDGKTKTAALVDPVMDYNAAAGRFSYEFISAILASIEERQLTLAWILETHIHADHLTAAQYVKQQAGGQVVTAACVIHVQQHFDEVFDLHSHDEALFDVLVKSGDRLPLGESNIEVLATPGHTQSCLTYVIKSAEQVSAFIGDTLFMPDVGTARCDFPGGDGAQLYDSIQAIYALGDEALLYLCHDYPPEARKACPSISVAQQKKNNVHCRQGVSKAEFMAVRLQRDATLAPPRLLLPSLQVNIRAGFLPEADGSGRRFLRIPIR